VRRFDLVDEPHSLRHAGLRGRRFRRRLRARRARSSGEKRRDVRSGGTAESQQALAKRKATVRIHTDQSDFDQADEQAPSCRLGQPKAFTEVDKAQPSRLGRDLIERGRGTTQDLDALVTICRLIWFPTRHTSTIVFRIPN